jgi:hypothetical protein
MDPAEILGSIVAVFFGVYIAFILTQQFCNTTPDFCTYGWTIFGALIFGSILFLKYKLFS